MLAVFAAFETDVRRERQLEGIAMTKRQEAYKGGPTSSSASFFTRSRSRRALPRAMPS
jgi:DNA invertase Pin-like site-specific DNA recombinase